MDLQTPTTSTRTPPRSIPSPASEDTYPEGALSLHHGPGAARNKSKDYIYQEELEAWEEDGMLTLFTAFSRDQAEKRYVTHCLR